MPLPNPDADGGTPKDTAPLDTAPPEGSTGDPTNEDGGLFGFLEGLADR